MGGALFGSAPKATFSTQPTILPQQEQLLQQLVTMLSDTANRAAVPGQTSLAALEGQAGGIPTGTTPQQTGATNTAFNALTGALTSPTPTIDSTAAFETGVVAPLTQNFNQNILPGVIGKYGASAGGAYSSDALLARNLAAQNLNTTLAGAGAQYALGAQQANQSAYLANQQNILKALGLTPGVLTTPETVTGANIGLSTAGLAPFQQMIADLIAGSTAPTQSTSAVGTAGSTGLIPGLLSGVGGNAGFGTAFGNWLFSDERIKHDIEHVGDIDGFPLYRFKYDGEESPRLGFLAQDVERRLPAAVSERDGVKAVDYAAVLTSVLEGA